MTTAASLVELLTARGETVAAAESLTGGLVAATIVEAPGASEVLLGGVVSYTADAKERVLGVDANLIASAGTVDPQVATDMARRVRELFGATWGVATTGVAGPGEFEGKPAGTVFVAIASEADEKVKELHVSGERAEVRAATVREVLALLADAISAS